MKFRLRACNTSKAKYHNTNLTRARDNQLDWNHENNAEIMLINENLTNEEESDFNDKYTRILVKYPKEIKNTNFNNADLDHSSEIRGLCLMKSSGEMLQNLPNFWITKTDVVFSFLISCIFIYFP